MGISKGISTSLFITAGFCTMTGFSLAILSNPQASAVDVTGTASANATVTVAEACTMESGGTNDSPHTATIPAGTLKENIGLTTFKVVCNDSEGFSVYAVGFANYEYGNTKLLATISGSLNPTYDIVTGLATSGNTSNWAMKLTAVSGTYAPTIQSAPNTPGGSNASFTAYHTVPATNTKVATFAGVTDGGDNANGSAFTATYRAFIAGTQPAGNYNGKVKYTMVHPASATANAPQDCSSGVICYFPNANGIYEGTMGQQTANANTETTLIASNFSKTGYGFAGWSDAYDWVINEGSPTNPDAHIYGPNETITTPSNMSNGLSLYAVWVKSEGALQGWTGCSNMGTNSVTALTDLRDGQTYAVAKLADDQCWMIENLRLEAANSTDSTLAQGFGGVFTGLATAESANFTNSTTANSLYSTANITGSNQDYRFPRYNNINTSSRASSPTSGLTRIYSYGNYYTWSAAMANTEDLTSYTDSEAANTSLCPTGWQLPYGRNTGKGNTAGGFYYLGTELGATASNATSSNIWRSYPNNFLYSGQITGSSVSNSNSYGYYRSSTAGSYSGTYVLYFYSISGNKGVLPGTSDTKSSGDTIRCVNI